LEKKGGLDKETKEKENLGNENQEIGALEKKGVLGKETSVSNTSSNIAIVEIYEDEIPSTETTNENDASSLKGIDKKLFNLGKFISEECFAPNSKMLQEIKEQLSQQAHKLQTSSVVKFFREKRKYYGQRKVPVMVRKWLIKNPNENWKSNLTTILDQQPDQHLHQVQGPCLQFLITEVESSLSSDEIHTPKKKRRRTSELPTEPIIEPETVSSLPPNSVTPNTKMAIFAKSLLE